ncbi:hypothetical protein T4D_1752 [Trichinella pseudospiralis]|uniref:Uncharacterized protein n=1 Tax=Trichinella pseudospiralis TaxID=6337 RepID=A0A0V1F7F6_TRIPS|nr:hypothetical protein T4D_4125 [Trichinella pseudospiralis]KRY82103.1 hypothetical protein T4D_1752 [Trichinella pseudospiralis]
MIPVTPKKQSRKEHQRFIRVEINLNFSYKHFVILLITDSQLESATSSPDDEGTPSITAGSNSRNFFVGRVISPFASFNRTNLTTPSLPRLLLLKRRLLLSVPYRLLAISIECKTKLYSLISIFSRSGRSASFCNANALLDVRRYPSFVHDDLGRKAHVAELYLSKNEMGLRGGRSLVPRFRTVLWLTPSRRVTFCPVPSSALSSQTEPNVPINRHTMVMYFHSILFDVNLRWVSSTNSFKIRPISLNDVDRVGRKIGQEPAKTFPSRAYKGPAMSKPVFSKGKTSTTLSLNWTASDLLLHANVECVRLSPTALLVGVDLATKLDTWCGTVGQSVVNVHQLKVIRCHQRTGSMATICCSLAVFSLV